MLGFGTLLLLFFCLTMDDGMLLLLPMVMPREEVMDEADG